MPADARDLVVDDCRRELDDAITRLHLAVRRRDPVAAHLRAAMSQVVSAA